MKKILLPIISLSMITIASNSAATEFEITPIIGQSIGEDLISGTGDVSVSTGTNIGLGIAWQDTPNGQGQVLFNYVTYDFDSAADNSKQSLDILYTHFNGIAQFRQQNYTTTMSIGLGGSMIKSDDEQEVYPSATIAVGTQYKINERINFVTEIRGYATWVDRDDLLFCDDATCHAHFRSGVFKEANVSIGVSIKF